MSTLLLRLAGPLQSWGTESKFDIRKTDRYPSKSGVVGLLAAALGLRRDAALSRLSDMRFGLRIDSAGELVRDLHTVRKDDKTSYLTQRYYLSDAVFLAGFESDDEALLNELDDALKHPVYPLFLGRRSCPPVLPLSLGLRDHSLFDALTAEPCQLSEYALNRWNRKVIGVRPKLRVIMDASASETVHGLIKDLPVSFSQEHRKFAIRPVIERYVDTDASWNGRYDTDHDPMSALDEVNDDSSNDDDKVQYEQKLLF